MNDRLYQIALTMTEGIGKKRGRELISRFGSAEAIFNTNAEILENVDGIGRATALKIHSSDTFKRAEKELAFIEKHNIRCTFISDNDYPALLKGCRDAPLMLYIKGNISFANKRIVSIVGTRKMTPYGREVTERFIRDLAGIPDVVIISGLAYGVDIHAHKCALKQQIPTVAVLAHGLDRIYPPDHRHIAVEMLQSGGILTEYMSETTPDRHNFLVRNRIIAGLSKATVVIESGYRGGSLNTAFRASEYGKAVFAFPGRATDEHSLGCNRIITNDSARLINCAKDFTLAMLWDTEGKSKQPVQQIIPFALAKEHAAVLEIFRKNETMNIDEMAIEYNIPLSKLRDSLSELELEGIIQPLPGNRYKLI